MGWLGNIFTAREGKDGEVPTEGYDGNYTYSNGTYGQSEYTVRERSDGSGLSDVYVDNGDGSHSHDVVDRYGNLVASYHDYLSKNVNICIDELNYLSLFNSYELYSQIYDNLEDGPKLSLRK